LREAWFQLEQQPLEAAVLARQAEHLARRSGDNRAWAQSFFIWGVSSLYGGDNHEAISLLSRALAVYRFLGDEQGQWSCLKAIALAWGYLGDANQALETHAHANAFKRQAEFARTARWLHWFAAN
jgi:tetratricopeptide (TPR) repeat protein